MLQPGDGIRENLLPVAGNACDSKNFTAPDTETDPLQRFDSLFVVGFDVLNIQGHLALFHWFSIQAEEDLSSHHHFRQLLLGGILASNASNHFPLAHDGDPVGDLHNLVQLVADEDDGFTFLDHFFQDLKEGVHFLGRQHRGGLVQDENLCAFEKGFDDLDPLLFPHGELPDLQGWIDPEVIFIGDFSYLFGGLFLVDIEGFRFYAKNNVFEDGQGVDQHEMLVNHPDSVPHGVGWIVELDLFPFDIDFPFIRHIEPVQDTHEGAFPRSVFPQEGMNLPF